MPARRVRTLAILLLAAWVGGALAAAGLASACPPACCPEAVGGALPGAPCASLAPTACCGTPAAVHSATRATPAPPAVALPRTAGVLLPAHAEPAVRAAPAAGPPRSVPPFVVMRL